MCRIRTALIFSLSFVTVNLNALHAQQLRCGIYYDYDAAGLRVKRYYDCKDPYATPIDPGTGPVIGLRRTAPNQLTPDSVGSLAVSVYPNPTHGQLFIRLPKAGTHTHFHIYASDGALVHSGTIETDVHSCDIGRLAPGTYVVKVYYDDKSYNFPVTKN